MVDTPDIAEADLPFLSRRTGCPYQPHPPSLVRQRGSRRNERHQASVPIRLTPNGARC